MTKQLVALACAFIISSLIGCGGGDPNKNLPPVDPNAKPPTRSQDGGAGQDKAPGVKDSAL